ncbi:hypothetical protein HRbin30_00396 [bacterium HR30]|nr:hypothetical protein HRbin30_00396 [bacterium HR30]
MEGKLSPSQTFGVSLEDFHPPRVTLAKLGLVLVEHFALRTTPRQRGNDIPVGTPLRFSRFAGFLHCPAFARHGFLLADLLINCSLHPLRERVNQEPRKFRPMRHERAWPRSVP